MGEEQDLSMVDQTQQLPPGQLIGTIPIGRGLLPEEIAEFKAKGREWSRLYKERKRKEISTEEVEERKLKNRLRQKRFRERQKSREQEEAAQLAAALHHQQINSQQQQAHGQEYDPNAAHYASPQGKMDESDAALHLPVDQTQPTETLVDKRKRLGRERQARFREKKRVRTGPHMLGTSPDGHHTQMDMESAGMHAPEIITMTELQKMSAQLSGYYTGLTQGLTQDAHQAVMRFFLDNIREELGDEVFGGAAGYTLADAQAHAAAAQAQYMVGQQGLELHALHAAAAAHMPQPDMQAHLQAHHGQIEHPGHIPPQHLHVHMGHPGQIAIDPNASQEAQMEYHRQYAEQQAQQQAAMAAPEHHTEAYEQEGDQKGHDTAQAAQSQHLPGPEQQGMLYAQPGVHPVHPEMLQAPQALHYVPQNP